MSFSWINIVDKNPRHFFVCHFGLVLCREHLLLQSTNPYCVTWYWLVTGLLGAYWSNSVRSLFFRYISKSIFFDFVFDTFYIVLGVFRRRVFVDLHFLCYDKHNCIFGLVLVFSILNQQAYIHYTSILC